MMYQRTTLLVVVVLLLCITLVPVLASETDWRWQANVGRDVGSAPEKSCQIGTALGASPGIGPEDGLGSMSQVGSAFVYSAVDGQLLSRDLRPPVTSPVGRPFWNLYVGAFPGYNAPSIHLWWNAVNGLLPPGTLFGQKYTYALRMMDNKGMYGAPSVGTTWNLPASPFLPTVIEPCIFLPSLVVSSNAANAVYAEAYRFQFTLIPVPEPASLLTFGGGLLTLGGAFIRRRK